MPTNVSQNETGPTTTRRAWLIAPLLWTLLGCDTTGEGPAAPDEDEPPEAPEDEIAPKKKASDRKG